jgi:CRP-like cAMP-binding protein
LLGQTARIEQYGRCASFFREGAAANDVFVLRRGGAKLVQTSHGREPFVVQVVGPSTLFGVDTLVRLSSYSTTAEALCACEALVWNGSTIVRLMNEHPPLATTVLQLMTARLDEARARCREIASEPVETRVVLTLLRLARLWPGARASNGRAVVDVPLSRRDLAHLAGSTMYTVSRILQRWERAGFVRCGRMHVMLLDVDGMRARTFGRVAGARHPRARSFNDLPDRESQCPAPAATSPAPAR